MRGRDFVSFMVVALSGLGVPGCWSTVGLGPGPYSSSPSSSECASRGLDGVVSHQSEASDQELLFCTDICGDEGPSACPLASYIASDYPELKIACLPAGSAGMSAEAKIEVCTLVAIKDCPDDMVSFESATGNVLCYFAAEN